jgi:hypothetical protein
MTSRMIRSGVAPSTWTARIVRCWALTGMVVVLGSGVSPAQGPSTNAPDTSLPVRPIEPLSAWIDELQTLNSRIQEKLREFETDPPKLSSIADLNETYHRTVRMARLARRLVEAREVAGSDFLARAESAQKRLKKWAEQIRQDPEFARIQSRIRKEFVSETKAREKKLTKVRTLVRQADWEKADESLGELVDELPAASLWLDASLQQQGLELFEPDRREVARGMSRAVQERLVRSLEEANLVQPPPVEALRQRIERAVKDHQQSDEVVYLGESLNGPALLRRFYEDWSEMQLQVTRHAAASSYRQQPRAIPAEQALEALSDRFPDLIEDLARSDATRGKPRQELLAIYASYVQTLAPVAARLFDESRVATLQKSLAPLANHPEIRDEIGGYRVATDVVLSWRRRIADSQVAAISTEFEPVDQTLQKAWQGTSGRQESFRWTQSPGEVADPLNELIPFLGTNAANKLVRLKAVDASRDDARRGTTVARGGFYGVVAVPPVPPGVLSGIRRDLLVDAEHPPLSLRAAATLWAVENGCVEEVGGPISEFGCEAVGPAWIGMTRQNAAFLPPGSLLTRDFRNLDKAICLIVTIQPTWIRYGTVLIRLR